MTTTTLYRLYDANDRLLYVGIAGNFGRRLEQHRAGQPWWMEAVSTRLEHFPTRAEAFSAETQAIKNEKPLHNKALNGICQSCGGANPTHSIYCSKKCSQFAQKMLRKERKPSQLTLPEISEAHKREMARLKSQEEQDRFRGRAIDDPVKLAQAAKIVRGALARGKAS